MSISKNNKISNGSTKNKSAVFINEMTAQDIKTNEIQESFLKNQSVDDYCKKVMAAIHYCRKCSNDLQGWKHYSDFSGVRFSMSRINKLLYNLISKFFMHQDIKLDLDGFKLIDQFELLREGNDVLMERINSDLDEATGMKKHQYESSLPDNSICTIRAPIHLKGNKIASKSSQKIEKPQLKFDPPMDNSTNFPFIPLVKEKPNSLKPLAIMLCINSNGDEFYSHPYEYELQHWSAPDSWLVKHEPQLALPLAQTPLVMVTDEEGLTQMVDELRNVSEFAVDVENHSIHSYQGLTCLIQISTREMDYIIDPFPLRNYLPMLNEVFTNPKITKVFHGSDLDVLWLQRDCGTYVVGMFDTHKACVVLEHARRSLAALVEEYCNIILDKAYKTADWRIRPLPEDYINYARQDTHHLLYIYDCLKSELIDNGGSDNNLLLSTYSRSLDMCFKRYEKPLIKMDSHMILYRSSFKIFNTQQLFALQKLYKWRDTLAREKDESPEYILPRRMMLQMADVLPREVSGVLACCQTVPFAVREEQLILHAIIREARDQPIKDVSFADCGLPGSSEWFERSLLTPTELSLNSVVPRHDIAIEDEATAGQGGLPSLLKPQDTLMGDLFKEDAVPRENISGLFGLTEDQLMFKRKHSVTSTAQFRSPYERYVLFRQFEDNAKVAQEKKSSCIAKPDEQDAPDEIETSDVMRINKLKKHYKELANVKKSGTVLDEKRLRRLQNFVSSAAAKDAEQVTEKEGETLKRKSDSYMPPGIKKRRTFYELLKDEAEDEFVAQKSNSEDGETDDDEDDSSREEQEAKGKSKEEEQQEEVDPEFEAFDYAAADYDIFKPAAVAKKNTKQFKSRFERKKKNESKRNEEFDKF